MWYRCGLFSKSPTTEKAKQSEPPFRLAEGVVDEASTSLGGDIIHLSIIVVGASSDLSKNKIFCAIFSLYYEDCLPKVWTLS